MSTKERQGKGIQKREGKELTDEDKKAIRRSFDSLDRDQNGRLCAEEIYKGVQVLGFNPTKSEAVDMISDIDENGNGHIEFEEYEEMMRKRMSAMEYEKNLLRDAFKKFDKDGDGTISPEELQKSLCKSGDKMDIADVNEMFLLADHNSDGKLNYEEFVEMFQEQF
ncbi:calmodulin-2-like [Mizuhopecten yessoensis]|uniref:Calmodulin-2 n=1 Tax=Mizuhopecten yessoensis TaxID=6573 RepID=A0A210QK96_MIZYE|nr:calmodulin-2-like [Mizuhopecten yessoensis]OWF49174.1 Calmodulin-2 [Mizuhopecten yessoensis]